MKPPSAAFLLQIIYSFVLVYNVGMDSDMVSIIKNADVQTKWRVVRKTMVRRKPVNGMQLGYIKDLVFYSNWIKDGWISIDPRKWVIASACERVDEPPAPPPEVYGNLVQFLPDRDLPKEYLKKDRNHVPQTVRPHHYGGENIPFTDDLISFMMALNPGMTRKQFEAFMDTYNRFPGEKFRLGNRKFPLLFFAENTHMVKRRFVWQGGLPKTKPGVIMLELETLHPAYLPDPATVMNSPYIVFANTVVNGRTNKYPGGATPRVALVSPVPLFIEEERTRPVTTLRYPYDV